MTTAFIYTPQGYININRIQKVVLTKDQGVKIVVDDVIIDSNNPNFGETVICTIPVAGEWECLTTCHEDDNSLSLIVEPVLAWGRTVLGKLVPFVPSAMGGLHENYALREKGRPLVRYGAQDFSNADQWLAYIKNPTHLLKTAS